ncbi:MAG TPA: phosphoribosylanthranilate isomerase [Actinomycetota bacterium]|nr:phosphoribosylanthranilate isomerase [Actinomycetota bacterium]
MRLEDPRGIWVKVDGVTRVEDVAAACDAGVSAIGMIFAISPRRLTLGQASRIREALPDGVSAFGVFDATSPGAVLRAVSSLSLDGVQVPAELQLERPGYPELPAGVVVLRTVRVRGPQDLQGLESLDCHAVHLDAYVEGLLGGTGHTAPWEDIEAVRPAVPWVLSGGLTADNVAEGISRLGPDGVDVSSGVESSPGVKDAEKLSAFVSAARAGA